MRRVIPMRRRPLGSITWGTRQNFLGFVTAADTDSGSVPLDPGSIATGVPANGGPAIAPIAGSGPIFTSPIFSQPPIVIGPTLPISPTPTPASGAPGTAPVGTPTSAAPGTFTTLPAQVPVVVTPSAGTIPDPATVAAATTTDTTSWFEQQMISGIPNWWLVAGAAGLYLLTRNGGKKR
jgi:hypothetical protein